MINQITNEMTQHIDDDFLKYLEEQSKKYRPCASLWIDKESDRLELILDTSKSTYSEHIKGEGADISLYRDNETNKVIGVSLPLYQTDFSIFHTDGIRVKINEGYLKNEKEKENN